MIDQLHLGTCEEVLAQYPDNFFHCVVTDPPYGLGEIRDLHALLVDWIKGEEGLEHQSKGFMARDWDRIPSPSTWREVYRVLRPGGYALVFASSRTWDMMSLALRLAGFDNRDTIVCAGVPALYWVQGSGFPKGQDIGKAIDKLAGAARPVVEEVHKTNSFSTAEPGWQRPFAFNADGTPSHTQKITAPATEEAKQWDGWHTTLKGATETILMFQKPISESTIAKNVLRWEAGAINVEATRVNLASTKDAEEYADSFDYESGRRAQNPQQSPRFRGILAAGKVGGVRKIPESGIAHGRWPTNLVLLHNPRCTLVGTTTEIAKEERERLIADGGVYGNGRRGNGGRLEQENGVWECYQGESIAVSSYAYNGDVLTPLSDPLHVLDQLQSLPAALRNCNMNGSNQANNVGAPSYIARIQQLYHAADQDAHEIVLRSLVHECVHALGLSRSVSSLYDCPVCLRLCGERIHQIVMAYQDGLPSLADALADIYSFLQEHIYILRHPPIDHDNVHGSPPENRYARRSESNNCASVPHFHEPGMASHTSDILPPLSVHALRSSSSERSSIRECDNHEICMNNACRLDLVQLLCFLSSDLVSHLHLSPDIIQHAEGIVHIAACPIYQLNLQSGQRKGTRSVRRRAGETIYDGVYNGGEKYESKEDCVGGYEDGGGAARYFPQFSFNDDDTAASFRYVPKASPAERESGCDLLPKKIHSVMTERPSGTFHERLAKAAGESYTPPLRGNTHVTVKPLALMRWLVRLVCPIGGIVLDPFAGSGSTCMAAVAEGMHYVGIEREDESFVIAQARVAWAHETYAHETPVAQEWAKRTQKKT